jgi:hypothetical protein
MSGHEIASALLNSIFVPLTLAHYWNKQLARGLRKETIA